MTRFHPQYVNPPQTAAHAPDGRVVRNGKGGPVAFTFRLLTNGTSPIAHHSDPDGIARPLCAATLKTVRVVADQERRTVRLCANCVRRASKRDLAAVRETIVPTTHVTAPAFGTLAIDRVDRASARTLIQKPGRAGLRAYLKAWGYTPETDR